MSWDYWCEWCADGTQLKTAKEVCEECGHDKDWWEYQVVLAENRWEAQLENMTEEEIKELE